jgi:hypothetical protein
MNTIVRKVITDFINIKFVEKYLFTIIIGMQYRMQRASIIIKLLNRK